MASAYRPRAAPVAADESDKNAHPPVSPEQLEMAKSYVKHRYRTGVNPVSVAAPGTEDPTISALTEAVLEREYNLVCTQIEHCEQDVFDLQEEFEALLMGTERSQRLLAMYDMKLRESRDFLDSIDRAMARAGVAIPDDFNGLATMHVIAETDATKIDEAANLVLEPAQQRRSDAAHADPAAPAVAQSIREGVANSQNRLQVSTEQSRLQKALVDAMRACITTQFAHLLESASAQCMLKRRADFSRQWCEQTMAELGRLQRRQDALAAEKAERERRIEEAKAALEEAHRHVFTKRKNFIITHKRLLGREKLPNGEFLRASITHDIITAIKRELQEGSTATLTALAETDCAELEKYTGSGFDTAFGAGAYRTPGGDPRPSQHQQRYTPRAAAAAWNETMN